MWCCRVDATVVPVCRCRPRLLFFVGGGGEGRHFRHHLVGSLIWRACFGGGCGVPVSVDLCGLFCRSAGRGVLGGADECAAALALRLWPRALPRGIARRLPWFTPRTLRRRLRLVCSLVFRTLFICKSQSLRACTSASRKGSSRQAVVPADENRAASANPSVATQGVVHDTLQTTMLADIRSSSGSSPPSATSTEAVAPTYGERKSKGTVKRDEGQAQCSPGRPLTPLLSLAP